MSDEKPNKLPLSNTHTHVNKNNNNNDFNHQNLCNETLNMSNMSNFELSTPSRHNV